MTNNPYPDYSYSPDATDSPAADSPAVDGQTPVIEDTAPRPRRLRRWLVPVIVGVLAFVVGVAAGSGGEEEAGPAVDLDAEVGAAVADVEDERDALATELDELRSERDDLASELDAVGAERDELAGEIEGARAERDEALERAEAAESASEEAQAAADAAAEEAEAAAEAAEPSASFGNGTWRVGEDIEPGTYRTDGASGCYWERLSGFSGEFGDIISNDFTSGPSTVTIQPSDAGFSSQGCGTWELMG